MNIVHSTIHEHEEVETEDLFARSPHRPNTQSTAPNDPFQSRQDPIVAEVHIIQAKMFAIRPKWMELQVLVSALTRRYGIVIKESSRCRRDQEHRRWIRAARYNLFQLQHHLHT